MPINNFKHVLSGFFVVMRQLIFLITIFLSAGNGDIDVRSAFERRGGDRVARGLLVTVRRDD